MASILNYETVREVSPAGWLLSYISIPTFSYTGIIWKGASEIVTQFNFAASKNFTIRRLPTAPVGVDYCAVIRWRSGTTVYRYKLWQTVGETLNEKLYRGEKIGANFVIEIWSTQTNTTVTNIAAVTFQTSIRTVPTSSYLSLAPYEEVVGVEHSSQFYTADSSIALPSAGLVASYVSESIVTDGFGVVTAWQDSFAGANLIPNGSNVFEVANALNGLAAVNLTSDYMIVNNPAVSVDNLVIFAVIKQVAWTSGNRILAIETPATTDNTAIVKQYGDSPNLTVQSRTATYSDSITILPIGSFDVLKFEVGTSIAGLYPIAASISDLGRITSNIFDYHMGTKFQIGPVGAYIAEILMYDADSMSANDIYQYLYTKFGIGVTLPLTNDSDLSGGNNT